MWLAPRLHGVHSSVRKRIVGRSFSVEWLDGPEYRSLEDVIDLDAVRRTFTEHLVTTLSEFKVANRRSQDPLPSAQKKFAFNPLDDKPFIEGVIDVPIAPSAQAILLKALPPAIYHLALRALGKDFADDLGSVFQHYVGRQLGLVVGDRQVVPEVRYGSRQAKMDSCDWFLELPDLVVLIECKARQPIESLRTGGHDWLRSVQESIGKGTKQLNRSDSDMMRIIAENLSIDATKPRVGLVVTLEPFYLNQNWLIRDELPAADLPVGVVSVAELESLVPLNPDELSRVLRDAVEISQENVLLLNPALDAAAGRQNSLLVATWESIGLFDRVESAAERFRDVSRGDE